MKSIMLSLVAGIAGSILFNVLHLQIHGSQQGVVRLDELLTEHVASMGKTSHSEEELKALSSQYAAALDTVMAEYAQRRIVLFVDQAVVTELPDYTDQIRERLRAKLEEVKP